MSAVLARTWNYLSGLGQEPGWAVPSESSRHSLPTGLANWLQQVCGAVSRSEEEELCKKQLELVVAKLSQPAVGAGTMADCMVRIIHIAHLGYDVSSAHIHCVKLASAGTILQRKMGYLACSLLLGSSDQLSLLLTNTILRDLASTNMAELQMGLVAAASLATPPINTPGLAESLLERALPLTSHGTPQVRSKAVALVHHLCAHQPQLWEECGGSNLLRSLSDQSPGVVSAALQAVACLAKHEEAEVAMAAALHLLHQLEEGKMPQDFHYRGHTAPFLRIHLARLFRRLHSAVDANEEWSEKVGNAMASWLEEASNCRDTIIAALGHEIVLAVALLESCRGLVPAALSHVSSLLQSRHHSHVYTGLQGLQALFARHPPCLNTDQERVVLSCLSHPDVAIQRRTLQLVLILATKDNLPAVLDRIVAYVKEKDEEESGEVVKEAAELVEKFGASLDWRASSLLRLVQVSKGAVREAVVARIKFLLAPPTTADLEPADELELNRVRGKLRELLNSLVEKGVRGGPAPSVVLALAAWCEGRWPGEGSLHRIQELGKPGAEDEVVIAALGAAQAVLVGGEEEGRETCLEWVQKWVKEGNGEVSLRAGDVAAVVGLVAKQCSPEVEEALEAEGVDDNEEKDWSLSFLDTFVLDSLQQGKIPYKPRGIITASRKDTSIGAQSNNQIKSRISAGLSESNSNGVSSLNSSELSTSNRAEPSTLWTLEGRVDVPSSPILQASPLTPPPPDLQGASRGLEGLLEEGWS